MQSKVPDAKMLKQCHKLSAELGELRTLEESYWHARARANELQDGDKNTSYFHHKSNQRMQRNNIKGLMDEEGV